MLISSKSVCPTMNAQNSGSYEQDLMQVTENIDNLSPSTWIFIIEWGLESTDLFKKIIWYQPDCVRFTGESEELNLLASIFEPLLLAIGRPTGVGLTPSNSLSIIVLHQTAP